MVAAADRSAGGWWRECSALSLHAVSRDHFDSSVHTNLSLIMTLLSCTDSEGQN